jgi:hypothetical protein
LTAYSLHYLPTTRVGTTHGVPLQSLTPSRSRTPFGALSLLAVYDIASCCSEDQEVTMPRSFKVLLPARIRTPRSPEGDPGPLLSWAFWSSPEPSSHRPGTSFPVPTLLRFPRPFSVRRTARRSRALPDNGTAVPLARNVNSHEVLHPGPVLGFSRGPWRPPGEPGELE